MEKETFTTKPLEQMLQNSNLNLLEAALPYVTSDVRRPLAMYIKFSELTEVMTGLEDEETLAACGLNEQGMNYEMMLQAMKITATKEQSAKLEQITHFINLSKMLPSMLDTTTSMNKTTPPSNEGDIMQQFTNFMQMKQQLYPHSNQEIKPTNPTEVFMSDPRTKNIAPEKLQLIQQFISTNQKKSPSEILPQMMQLSNQMKNQGLSLTKIEMELLIDVLKSTMTPEERTQIDRVIQMLG